MPTSDGLACPVCGELPDITKFGWGCVFCNPERRAAAAKPEVPVNPGPADRVGCLQHGEINCERCGLLETRHRLALEEYTQRPDGGWERDGHASSGALGLLLFWALLLILLFGCGYTVWSNWPR